MEQTNNLTFVVEPEDAGVRLDKFLAARMPEFSRSEIQRMAKNMENARRLKAGEEVVVQVPNAERGPNAADPLETDGVSAKFDAAATAGMPRVIYEDIDIIAVDKPRGMVMYPAAGNRAGTLVQALAAHCRLSPLGGETRPGVVHRIDKDTSGVVLLAKSDAAFRALVKTFSEHDLTRKYVALCWGVPPWTDADIEGNIARSTRNRQKMSMVKSGGKTARTSAHVAGVWPRAQASEIRCALMTGRTHQIRVHLSAHGFPVMTDPLYGRGRETGLRRGPLLAFLRGHVGQCLHAESLELNHPITGAPLKLRAPLPSDMAELKDLLDDY